jgi:hypothetical protein
MSTQEVEKKLGQQYAMALKENPQFISVYRDCEDVIHGALTMMEHYNKIAMAMKNKDFGKQMAGMFS